MLQFASTSVQVLGKEVIDPRLQLVSAFAFLLLFAGTVGLWATTRMVHEERVRAEASVSKLFGRGLPPRRVLSDGGRKLQTAASIATGVGLVSC